MPLIGDARDKFDNDCFEGEVVSSFFFAPERMWSSSRGGRLGASLLVFSEVDAAHACSPEMGIVDIRIIVWLSSRF
jgi:hypothetical protein